MTTQIRLKNLNIACEQSWKSKAAIAREMGISPQRLNDMIHGSKPISLYLIVPFCKAVGCDPNHLFGWDGE